jgi:guanylate kinase
MCESNELAEWAEVHGYLYGTPFKSIEAHLNEGRTVLMDIDIEGARSIRRIYPDDSLLIFVRPPSLEILKDRLRKRCTEEDSEIQKRLERVDREFEASSWFDHVVVNDDLEEAVDAVEALIKSRRKNQDDQGR